MNNDVYYKLYKMSKNNLITIVCMQWFDENDYYKENFVKNSSGEDHKFESEDEAIERLNNWYKSDEIDPEYRLDYRKHLIRD